MAFYPNDRPREAAPAGEAPKVTSRRQSRLAAVIIIGVAAASLIGAFLTDGPEAIAASLAGADRLWLAAGAGCMLFYWLIESGCLHLAAKRAFPGQRWHTSVVTSMIGQFFNCVTPFASGGQPVQAYYMARQGMPVGRAGSVLLAKFIVYQTVLALYSAAVLVFEYRNFSENIPGFMGLALLGFVVNFAVVVVLYCVGFFPRITGSFFESCLYILGRLRLVRDPEAAGRRVASEIEAFHGGFTELRREGGLLLRLSGLTAVQLTAFFLVPYCVLRALGLNGMAPQDVIAAAAFILMISSFVPLPGASGGAEGSFLVFFGMFFRGSGSVSVALLLWRLFTFYLPIVVGAVFVRQLSQPGRRQREAHPAA